MILAVALLSSVFVAGPLAVPAFAQTSAGAKRKELRDVQRQLEQKKREIDEYRKEADDLKRDLSKLAGETSESRRKIRTLEENIRKAESRKDEIKGRLGSLELAEGQWHRVLSEEVNAYFRHELNRSDFYGRREVWREALRRAAIVEKLRYVEQLSGTKRQTQALAQEAARRRQELQSKSEKAKAEHQTRENLYHQKKEVYDVTQEKVSQAQKTIQELQDSAVALTRLLHSFERKAPYRAKGGPIPLAEPPHSLPWPAEGKIVGSFGRQLVPELHTWFINQGIRLATLADAPIHAVKTGKVIYAGLFRSYGEVMIVDHGGEFFTIYGHLGKAYKKKGDSVRPSDTLATAGPEKDGGQLYFEIRQSGEALDPAIWLKGK